MNLVGAALSDELDLSARGAIEVRSLISRADFEFLNAVHRSRHNTCWRSAARAARRRSCRDQIVYETTGRVARKAGRVGVLGAIHVAGIIPAIQHKRILILISPCDAAIHGNTGLKGYESAHVAAKTG